MAMHFEVRVSLPGSAQWPREESWGRRARGGRRFQAFLLAERDRAGEFWVCCWSNTVSLIGGNVSFRS